MSLVSDSKVNELIDSNKSYIGSFEMDDETVWYSISPEQVDKIIEKLIKYYSKYSYIGEVIMQNDDAQIYAPEYLAEIADEMITFTDNMEEALK